MKAGRWASYRKGEVLLVRETARITVERRGKSAKTALLTSTAVAHLTHSLIRAFCNHFD
jgi:hypothetical protein